MHTFTLLLPYSYSYLSKSKFNCFPIAPENIDITEKLASPKSLEIRRKRNQREAPREDPRENGGGKIKVPKNKARVTPYPLPKIATGGEKFSNKKLAPNLLPKKNIYVT